MARSSERFRPFQLEGLPLPEEALKRWLAALPRRRPRVEWVPLGEAAGRVLAEDIGAQRPVPHFARSQVDGVALRAADTATATDDAPVHLRLRGRVAMGRAPGWALEAGEAALVPTGGMLPPGADAVVMVEEFPELLGHGWDRIPEYVAVHRLVSWGDNVIPPGADVQPGEVVLTAGRRLRAHDVGVLAGVGMAEVPVFVRPEVAVISTGVELVPPEEEPGPGQIRDVNAVALGALVEQGGGRMRPMGIVPDDRDALRDAIVRGLQWDMVVLSGGSSVGEEDWTARIVEEMGPPGIIVHGVRLAPGKPTLLALVGDVPVVGAPGNPVSAQVVFRLYGVPALRRIGGEADPAGWHATVRARLTEDVKGPRGRELHMRVALVPDGTGWLARPIKGGSHQLMTMVAADGLITVPPDETLSAGTVVEVRPWG